MLRTSINVIISCGQDLYKTQTLELKEEIEEKTRSILDLEEERGSLAHQLQIALARADTEALARSIAEETIVDLEKEKTMKELELKDLLAKHRADIAARDSKINLVRLHTHTTKMSNMQLVKLY